MCRAKLQRRRRQNDPMFGMTRLPHYVCYPAKNPQPCHKRWAKTFPPSPCTQRHHRFGWGKRTEAAMSYGAHVHCHFAGSRMRLSYSAGAMADIPPPRGTRSAAICLS